MNERTTKKIFEIYMKYALKYQAEKHDEDFLMEMWDDNPLSKDFEDFRTTRILEDEKQLVEDINAENLTTEEKIYIGLKVGMLM